MATNLQDVFAFLAVAQAGGFRGAARLAATFIVPYVPKTHVEKHGVRELVEGWLSPGDIMPIGKGPLLYAYVFPGKWQDFISDKAEVSFPGAMLVLEKRKHANKFAKAP